MFKYLMLISTVFPLIGVFLMENGAYGISIGQYGYKNGATLVYLAYVVTLLFVFYIFKKKHVSVPHSMIDDAAYYRYSYRVICVCFLMVFCMVVLFGAYNVWIGVLGKGEFRASLGGFGVLAYLMTKFFAPCLLAYQTFLYVNGSRCLKSRVILTVGLFFGILLGSTWGFKSTGLSIILPSILILFWNSKPLSFFKVSVVSLGLLLLMGFIFDGSKSLLASLQFLWVRLTVIQGDVSWFVWGLFCEGDPLPSYMKTLLAIMGDRLLVMFVGISKNDYSEWATYHYDILIHEVIGLPLDVVKAGHNIVGTPFSEGLIMLGVPGVLIMAILGGLISSLVFNRIQDALNMGRGISAALWSSYFCLFVFSWLRSGALTQLVHISIFVGLVSSYILIFLLRNIVFLKKI